MASVSSTPPPVFIPGLWGSLSVEERERITEQVKKKDETANVARYVNHHADEFLPSIQASDLKAGAQKRVEKAVANGTDLSSAIRTEALNHFEQRYDNTAAAIDKALAKVKDPIIKEQLTASKARLADATTVDEKAAALSEARGLLQSVPGHDPIKLDVQALKNDETSGEGQVRVGQMGRMYATAHAIDVAGNSDGNVDPSEVAAYFTALEGKVGTAQELEAQRAKVLDVANQLRIENGAGSLAEAIDSRVRVGGGAEGATGPLIGNGDGKLSRKELNAFIKEMKTREASPENQLMIDSAQLMRMRFIKP